jgi:hypothetical protein
MTVSPQIPSDRDLELLSTYLDGELTDREKEKLEQRLAREKTLRATLDDLRETVTLVRDLPRLKAPRDFTLDPSICAHPAPWWKRLLPLETALQLSGALGAAASIMLIVLAVLLGQGTSEKSSMSAERPLSDQAAPGQPPQIAMQATLTAPYTAPDTPVEETSIAYAGEGLLQTTMAAQSLHYATEQTAPTLLPTPTVGPASPTGEAFQGNAAAETEDNAELEAGAVTSAQEEMPAPAVGGEGAFMMEADGGYPAAEPQDTVGAASAPAPPAAAALAPSATASEEMLGAPQMAPPAESGFRDDGSREVKDGSDESQTGGAADTTTNEVSSATASPVPAIQTQTWNASEKPETSEASQENPQRQWWLAGIGLVTLVFSITLFAFGRRKARA